MVAECGERSAGPPDPWPEERRRGGGVGTRGAELKSAWRFPESSYSRQPRSWGSRRVRDEVVNAVLGGWPGVVHLLAQAGIEGRTGARQVDMPHAGEKSGDSRSVVAGRRGGLVPVRRSCSQAVLGAVVGPGHGSRLVGPGRWGQPRDRSRSAVERSVGRLQVARSSGRVQGPGRPGSSPVVVKWPRAGWRWSARIGRPIRSLSGRMSPS